MHKFISFGLIYSCNLLFSTDTPPPTEVSLPSSRPCVSKGSNLSLELAWIYWQANETGLSYALNNDDYDLEDDTLMGTGYTAQPKFEWNSGFRLGIGYNLPHDDWDIQCLWTSYEGKAHDSQISDGSNPTILPSFVHPNVYNAQAITAVLSANADLTMHLNVINLTLGKQIKLGSAFSLKPNIGMRTAWLYQTYNVDYHSLFDKMSSEVLVEYSTQIGNDFWGLGILGGLSSQWDLKWGLSLFGDFDLSLLYGFFDTSYMESYITPTGAGATVISETNNFRAGRAIADLELGIRWTSPSIKDRLKIVLQGGWEQHMYFSQNQMIRFCDGQNWGQFVQNQGDVEFQGCAATMSLYF